MRKVVKWEIDLPGNDKRVYPSFDEACAGKARWELRSLFENYLLGKTGRYLIDTSVLESLLISVTRSQEILAGLLSREMLAEELKRRFQEKV